MALPLEAVLYSGALIGNADTENGIYVNAEGMLRGNGRAERIGLWQIQQVGSFARW